ncbi:GAF and ANTAR domain-containing protein [Amycolatopsis japonica]|uniref:GAF and ANTAR domain-containing protein n=1 Tax=Amycolatopsis japonica TaxID=208439 RepID=UPI0033261FD8
MDEVRRDRLWRLVADRAETRIPGAGWVQVVCGVAREETGADGAAVSLRTPEGQQELIAATGGWATVLEELQYTVGEGPAVEAYSGRGPVLVNDVTVDEQRWPGFAEGASGHRLGAAFSFPLQVGAIRLGTFSAYRRSPGPLSEDGLSSALILADIVTTALLTDNLTPVDAQASWARGNLMGHYDDVNMATGMIASRLGISLDDALLRLRAHAFSHQTPITEVAKAVVNRRLRFDASQE